MKKVLSLIVAGSLAVAAFGQADYCGKIIGGYVADWNDANTINYNQLTHAYFAFIGSDNDGNLCTYEASGTSASVKPKLEDRPEILKVWNQFLDGCNAAHTKKIISIGGYGCDPYMNAMASGGHVQTFVTNLMAFIDKYNLDGADLDWEDLADGTQTANYQAVCDALLAALHAKGKLLFSTVPMGYRAPNFPHASVANCDYVQLMAYDQTATWDQSPAGNHSTISDANTAISKWAGYGVASSKMVLGLPFYGYQQANSGGNKTKDWSWKDFVAAYPSAGDVDNFPVPGTSETIGLNGPTTIKTKTGIGYNNAGVMVWEMQQDVPYSDAKSLHKAIIDKMLELCPGGHGNPTGINEITSAATHISYNAQLNQLDISVAQQGSVKVSLINLLGQEIFSRNLGTVNAGSYTVGLNKTNLQKGIYVVSVIANNASTSAKILVE